jgi:hypothetical protein
VSQAKKVMMLSGKEVIDESKALVQYRHIKAMLADVFSKPLAQLNIKSLPGLYKVNEKIPDNWWALDIFSCCARDKVFSTTDFAFYLLTCQYKRQYFFGVLEIKEKIILLNNEPLYFSVLASLRSSDRCQQIQERDSLTNLPPAGPTGAANR